MIVKLQKKYSQESPQKEDKNTLKAKDLLAPGVATASAAGISQYAHKLIEDSNFIDDHYNKKKKWFPSEDISEEEKSKIEDYLRKYAKEKWGKNLVVSDIDTLDRSDYAGFHLTSDLGSNIFAKTGLTPEEVEKIVKEHPELLTEKDELLKLVPKYVRSIPDYIYTPKGDPFVLSHELGHHEISHAKSKSLLDFWEKIAQKGGSVSEGLNDIEQLKNVKNVALPLISTVPYGFYVDDKDDDKIKLNKNSLIAPGALMVGDSLVPVFESGATRRGIELMKNSGVVKDPKLLDKLKDFHKYDYNTIERKSERVKNLASLAVTTGLGLGVSRLNAQLLKNKKLKETEKDKEDKEKYLIPTNSQYLIQRKDKYKGLTEEEIKRKKKADILGVNGVGGLGIVGGFLGGLSLNTLRKSEELGKRAGMQEIADRLKNSNAKMKIIVPSSLMLAGGIGSSIYANKLNKRIKADNDKKTKSYSDTKSEEDEEKLNDRIKGSIYSGATGGLLGLGAVYGAEKIGDKVFYNKSIKLSNKNDEFFKKEREINPDFKWGWRSVEEDLRQIKTPELKEGLEKWLKLQKRFDKFRAIKNMKPLPQLIGLTSGIGGGVGLYNLYKNKKENKEKN